MVQLIWALFVSVVEGTTCKDQHCPADAESVFAPLSQTGKDTPPVRVQIIELEASEPHAPTLPVTVTVFPAPMSAEAIHASWLNTMAFFTRSAASSSVCSTHVPDDMNSVPTPPVTGVQVPAPIMPVVPPPPPPMTAMTVRSFPTSSEHVSPVPHFKEIRGVNSTSFSSMTRLYPR
jgi:hypothetical protein